jgi:uncharacterized protein (DUF488 family)
MRILTFGHGTAGEIELAALIRGAGIRSVADVRSVPKSRAHPHVWSERMARWVPDLAGASYRWRRELGGFRKSRPDSPNVALRHPAFRGYADYMQTREFGTALDALLNDAAKDSTAIMCSETLWWRCHRRLIADALVVRGWRVEHLGIGDAPVVHELPAFAVVGPDGVLTYPPAQTTLLEP